MQPQGVRPVRRPHRKHAGQRVLGIAARVHFEDAAIRTMQPGDHRAFTGAFRWSSTAGGLQARGNPQALSPAFTAFANDFGLPAISVPCGFDDNGVPIGIQFVGKP